MTTINVTRSHGRSGGGHPPSSADHGPCTNCGAALLGSHCHLCGQAGHVHRSLAAIAHEIGHGVFHFEGKVWRTLPMLLLRPGELTRRYVAGERVKFVSPLAMFLFAVFLMFASFGAVGALVVGIDVDPAVDAQRVAELDYRIAVEGDEMRELGTRLPRAAARDREDIQEQIADRRGRIADLERKRADAASADLDQMINIPDVGWARLEKGVAKANSNPDLTLYKLQTSAYKYSWLIILLSTPFLALLFFTRREYRMYDHAVFVTYSLSFMMLLAIVLVVAGAAGLGAPWIPLAATCLPLLHMYVQMRGAYALRRRAAIWRTCVLAVFAITVLVLFFTLIVVRDVAAS